MSTWIAISLVPSNFDLENLKRLFSGCGTILKVSRERLFVLLDFWIIFSLNKNLKIEETKDGDHKRVTIEYDSQASCSKAIEVMNNKKLGKNQIRVESLNVVKPSSAPQPESGAESIQSLRERIGEHIYPIALEHYKQHAGKLCGMVVDSLVKLNEKKSINIDEILSNQNTLVDLVHEANKKLNS